MWKANRYGRRRQWRIQQFSYHGRRNLPPIRLLSAAACAVLGLLLIVVRLWGMRFTGFLLLTIAGILLLSRLVDRLSEEGGGIWRLVQRGFYGLLALGLAVLLCVEGVVLVRGHRDESALPADAVIVLGAGVNGTTPSLSLRTRLDAALTYLTAHPEIPAVLTGGQGYGEDITEAQCMYDWLTAHGVDGERLILEETAANTKENLSRSAALLTARGIDVTESAVAVVTNDFHIARTQMLADIQGYQATPGIPAKLPWRHLAVNYYIREAFALGAVLFL